MKILANQRTVVCFTPLLVRIAPDSLDMMRVFYFIIIVYYIM